MTAHCPPWPQHGGMWAAIDRQLVTHTQEYIMIELKHKDGRTANVEDFQRKEFEAEGFAAPVTKAEAAAAKAEADAKAKAEAAVAKAEADAKAKAEAAAAKAEADAKAKAEAAAAKA